MFENNSQFHEGPDGYNDEGYRQFQQPLMRRTSLLTRIWRFAPVRYILAGVGLTLTVAGIIAVKLPRTHHNQRPPYPQTAPIPTYRISNEITGALAIARKAAEDRAAILVSRIVADMRKRTADVFLPSYFGYARQQELALKGLWFALRRTVDGTSPSAAEQLRKILEADLLAIVVRPSILSVQLTQAATETVGCYLAMASDRLDEIPSRMNIPAAEWKAYAAELSGITSAINANRRYPIVLKAVGVTGTMAAVRFIPVGWAIGKTGAAMTARVAGRMMGPLIAIFVGVFDIWDHRTTVAQAKPVLIRNLNDYFDQLEVVLLAEVMAAVGDVESQIIAASPKSDIKQKGTGE